MEVLGHLRSSFCSRHADSNNANNSNSNTSTDSNNNDPMSKKRAGNSCDICGKRLLKVARWRNYFTLPCKSRHVFCKQCITERLECRQKVMRSASFDLMWTFPCPGNAQCGQELTVDWSRGSSYSKNLVARDLGSSDDSWEQDEDEDENDDEGSVCGDHDVTQCGRHDATELREIG